MLDVRAWALARPISEQDTTGDALADRMEQIKKTEEEQGRSTFLVLRSEFPAVIHPNTPHINVFFCFVSRDHSQSQLTSSVHRTKSTAALDLY